MSIISKICRGRDLMLAVTQDVISMGGYWIANGQTKTGELLDEWQSEEDLLVERMTQYYINQCIKEASDEQK